LRWATSYNDTLLILHTIALILTARHFSTVRHYPVAPNLSGRSSLTHSSMMEGVTWWRHRSPQGFTATFGPILYYKTVTHQRQPPIPTNTSLTLRSRRRRHRHRRSHRLDGFRLDGGADSRPTRRLDHSRPTLTALQPSTLASTSTRLPPTSIADAGSNHNDDLSDEATAEASSNTDGLVINGPKGSADQPTHRSLTDAHRLPADKASHPPLSDDAKWDLYANQRSDQFCSQHGEASFIFLDATWPLSDRRHSM
jgi:hypothetical protein